MGRGLIAAVVVGSLLAAAPAEAGQPSTLTVTPDVGIVDGQGLAYETDIVAAIYGVHPCNDPADAADCVGDQIDARFSPSGTVTARRWVGNEAEGRVVDCAWEQCWMHVDGFVGTPPDLVRVGHASTPIAFEPTNDLEARRGDGITRIYASFFGTPPGSAAFAMRCAGVEGRFVCGDVGTIDVAFDGSFDGTVPSSRTFTAGSTAVDCDVVGCGVAVVVLSPGPVIGAVRGAPDPWN